MPTDTRVVLVTAPSEQKAAEIASALLDEHLIACANLVPTIRSLYRWEGRVEDDAESLLILKTTAERAPRLTERIVELHPYDVPEVLVLAVESGHDAYLAWVGGEVAARG